MTYTGHVKGGVIIIDGPERPSEGAFVRVEEVGVAPPQVGKALDALAGKAHGLPADLSQKHDQYRRERAAS